MKKNCNPYSDLIHEFSDTIWNGLEKVQVAEIITKLKDYQGLYIEIGSGSGNFLINIAAKNPRNLYIGIELRYKRCVRTIQKAQKLTLTNILIIREDANLVLPQIPCDIVNGIYINFPDPWEKARWLKHRMVSTKFLNEAQRILPKAGFIKLKTDHDNYYHSSKALIQEHPNFKLCNYSEDLHSSEFNKSNILTEFEQLFQSKQKNVYFLHYSKK